MKMSKNPFDENAVEEAVRLKEAMVATEVVSAGVARAQETLRTALAIGADLAVLIEANEELQPLVVAKLLTALVDNEQPQPYVAVGISGAIRHLAGMKNSKMIVSIN